MAPLLHHARKAAGLTQAGAARKLGVSQPYLSLLEAGRRELTAKLARKAVTLYRMPPTALPLHRHGNKPAKADAQTLTEQLSALGYPGFAHVPARRACNPAEFLFAALAQNNLDSRLAGALPWVVWRYPELDWDWLVSAVKLNNLQNRLGFVTAFARRLAEASNDAVKTATLKTQEARLEAARLVREDTLCHESLSLAERNWLRKERPTDALHWNLLTDLSPQHANYPDV
jgi:transcriptional regulator with XRE-family HTH domain